MIPESDLVSVRKKPWVICQPPHPITEMVLKLTLMQYRHIGKEGCAGVLTREINRELITIEQRDQQGFKPKSKSKPKFSGAST